MKPSHRFAWGIDLRQSATVGLVGVAWFQSDRMWQSFSPWSRLAGHNWMIWTTRREARAELHRVKQPHLFPRARVVRVRLTVRTAKKWER